MPRASCRGGGNSCPKIPARHEVPHDASAEFPDLVRVVAPTDATVVPPVPGTFACDLAGMRADPAFMNTFEVLQSNFAFHVADNARVSASLDSLHAALDETLGLAHE